MNKQNFVSSELLARSVGKRIVKTATMCLVPISICLLTIFLVRIGIGADIKNKERQLVDAQVGRSEYTAAQDSVTQLQAQLDENIANIQRLQGTADAVTDYDLMMDYIIKEKPAGVTIISIEDADVVPLIETAGNTNKLDAADIIEGTEEQLPTYIPENVGVSDGMEPPTEPPAIDENGVISSEVPPPDNTELPPETLPDGSVLPPVDPTLPVTATSEKYKNSLLYTRDIGEGSILLRGYSEKATQVAKYVTSLSKTPQVSGYTIEGAETKNVIVGGLPVVLFELKLTLNGGQNSESVSE